MLNQAKPNAMVCCLPLDMRAWFAVCALVIGTAFSVVIADDQPTWQPLAPLPVPVFLGHAQVVDSKIVVTGGITAQGATCRLVQVYDPTLDRWQQYPAMLAGRFFHKSFAVGPGRLMLVGGMDRTGLTAASSVSASALELISFKATPVGLVVTGAQPATAPKRARWTMPTIHRLDEQRVAVVTGSDVRIFDAKGMTWQTTIRLRKQRHAHGSALLTDGRLVVVGGARHASIELVDLDTGTSTLLKVKLPGGLDDMAVLPMADGRAWIIGGQWSDSGDTTDRTWLLSVTGEASQLIDGPRLSVAAGVSDQLVHIDRNRSLAWLVGGESQQNGKDTELADAFRLDLKTATVTRLPPMPTPHDDAMAVALDGQLVVIGGQITGALAGRAVPIALSAVAAMPIHAPIDLDAAALED